MKRIRSTNDRLVDVIVFDPKKNIKLQPVTPLMPLEALLIPVNLTDSDSDGINGGTGCITVPTTCSRPSIEMIGFMYVCMYVFINVFLRVHSPGHTVIYF